VQPRANGEAVSGVGGKWNDGSGTDHLMELVVEHGNLKRALKRVKANKGSPGIDGMTVEELPVYCASELDIPLRRAHMHRVRGAPAGSRSCDRKTSNRIEDQAPAEWLVG